MSYIVEGSQEGQVWNLQLQLQPETDVSLWSHQQDCGGARPFGVESSVVHYSVQCTLVYCIRIRTRRGIYG